MRKRNLRFWVIFALILVPMLLCSSSLVPTLLRGNGLTYAEERNQGTDAESSSAQVFVQMGHSSFVTSMSFSPDGKYALPGSVDNTLVL